ncbi:MAG: hypothetical protein AW07_02097 [Candidatus Accumulibacter sp. SK-11]|nr:MAG: hypothetical protein AW07_02097 [Candidatus Accumulibacter sp. SK-11]
MQLFDLMLDRQTVTVPARDVRRIEAGECARADDDVLEDLVHRVADMDVAVGVGRSVVQDETWASLRHLADALVKTGFLPGGNPLGFAPWQVAAHRKRGVGEVEGLPVVGHDGSHNWK